MHLLYKLAAATLVSLVGEQGLKFRTVTKCFNKFKSKLENEEMQEPTQEETQRHEIESAKDKFFEYILEDTNFMRSHTEVNYTDVIKKLDKLLSTFSVIKKGEILGTDRVPKNDIIGELSFIEIEMYSLTRTNGKVFDKKVASACTIDSIKSKLEYLGYDVEELMKDAFVSDVMLSIKRVLELPYDGCEVEISKLFLTLVEHLSGGNKRHSAALYERVNSIDKEITKHINDAMGEDVSQDINIENQKGKGSI